MIKRLALICCILLLPTIAAAQGSVNYGDFWVGVQAIGVFTADRNVKGEVLDFTFSNHNFVHTPPAVGAGAIVGYNFCMSYRQPWERYFGVALDFQWNSFRNSINNHFTTENGNQFALAFLGRLQYPFMGSETFTRGRLVPFLMFGPALVWSNTNFSDLGGNSKTSTDIGIVAEVGLEYFIIPQLSFGPSFRYRHVFGPNHDFQNVKIDSQLDQFMILGRLAYHF